MNYNISCHIGGTAPAPAVFYLMKEWTLRCWHLVRHLVTLLLLWAWKQTTLRCHGLGLWKYTFLTVGDGSLPPSHLFPHWLVSLVYTNYHRCVSCIKIMKFSNNSSQTENRLICSPAVVTSPSHSCMKLFWMSSSSVLLRCSPTSPGRLTGDRCSTDWVSVNCVKQRTQWPWHLQHGQGKARST